MRTLCCPNGDAEKSRVRGVANVPNQHSTASKTGAVAQLGERLVCNQEVDGSSPFGSIPSTMSESPFSLLL